MKTFLKPIWWIPVFLVPQLLVFFYESSIYAIVKTEIPNAHDWIVWGAMQLSVFLLSSGYIAFAFFKKKNIHWIFPVLLLPIEIGLFAWFMQHDHDLLPWSVPNWMVNRDEFTMFYIACVMPALFFSILQLVSYSIKEERKNQLPWSLVFIVAVPAAWYGYIMVLVPLINRSESFGRSLMIDHIAVVLGVISIVVFFFFLIRTLLLLGKMMAEKSWVRVVLVLVCCLIAPLLGLLINNDGFYDEDNVFGDFSHWLFYALTVFNALLLLIPKLSQKWLERMLVALRFFTLPFSLYFLVVFIPFLPLSVAAMVLAGAGILLLAPVLNFIIHVHRLSQDLQNKEIFPSKISRWSIALPIVLLPLMIHLNYLYDRHDLRKALAWIYAPDYSEHSTEVSPERISYIINVVSESENRSRNGFRGRKYWKPYLSSYYRWLVLDNMTLSNAKIAALEWVFTGSRLYSPAVGRAVAPASPEVSIHSLKTETKTDAHGKFYRTTIHLEIKNNSDQQQEFIRQFTLPDGAWISDYYLDIGDKREHGILAEKKTAQWVYRNIVNRRRDPGIVSYRRGNELELRVFPLEAGETRRTGMEVIHKGPLEFPFGTETVSVNKPWFNTSSAEIKIVTAEEKRNLPQIERKKKYYLLLDNSKGIEDEKTALLDRAQEDMKILINAGAQMEVYSVNHSAEKLGMKVWRPLAEGKTPQGGFFVERIMKAILAEQYRQNPEQVPVFLLYTEQDVHLPKDFMDFTFTFPDLRYCFISKTEGCYALSYDIEKEENTQMVNTNAARLAMAFQLEKTGLWISPGKKKYIVPAEGSTILFYNQNYLESNADSKQDIWEKAAAQESNTRFLLQHPEQSEIYWRKQVTQNFETGILSPYTSYLVVETESQKEVLRQKQKEVLNAAKYFDIEEEFTSMDEPTWYWYLLIPLLFVWIKKITRQFTLAG